jgi:hypothetical protein
MPLAPIDRKFGGTWWRKSQQKLRKRSFGAQKQSQPTATVYGYQTVFSMKGAEYQISCFGKRLKRLKYEWNLNQITQY